MDEATKLMFGEIKEDLNEIKCLLRKQDNRVRKLEDWRTGIVAIGSFIIVLLGFIKWLL